MSLTHAVHRIQCHLKISVADSFHIHRCNDIVYVLIERIDLLDIARRFFPSSYATAQTPSDAMSAM